MTQQTSTTVNPWSDDDNFAYLSIFLWSNSGGMAHSFAMYRDLLKEVGCQSVNQLSERWLMAKNYTVRLFVHGFNSCHARSA